MPLNNSTHDLLFTTHGRRWSTHDSRFTIHEFSRALVLFIALCLAATASYSQQPSFSTQAQSQQPHPCVQTPGGPPCLPAMPTASDYSRSGVPTIRSPQPLPPGQYGSPGMQGSPAYTLPQTPPPGPLQSGVADQPPPTR